MQAFPLELLHCPDPTSLRSLPTARPQYNGLYASITQKYYYLALTTQTRYLDVFQRWGQEPGPSGLSKSIPDPPACLHRLKKLPSKVLEDSDDDDLSTDGGSVFEAPLSYSLSRDSVASQL